MFRKLVSNLAFSPALVGQLGFYAKRLKKEEATRRIGLIFTALALVVQSFAVFSPPEAANASSPADFIRGGFSSKTEFLKHYDANTNNIKDLFNVVGITRNDIDATSKTQINTRNGEWRSWGLVPHFSYAQGERAYTIQTSSGGTRTFYSHPLKAWDTGNNIKTGSYYNVLMGTATGNGTASGQTFALMFVCGNLVLKVVPPPPPCPTNTVGTYPSCAPKCTIPGKENLVSNDPKCKPDPKCTVAGKEQLLASDPACRLDPVAACTSLKIDKIVNNYQFNAQSTAANGAKIISYVYVIKKDGKTIDTITAASPLPTNVQNYTQRNDGNYTVSLTVKTSLGDKTSPDCIKTFNITPPEVCPQNPAILKLNPECQPCAGDSTTWFKDPKCAAKILETKTAKNITQNNVDASETTAKAGDKIIYTLNVQNTGKTAAETTVTENLADVMEYATIVDNGGGHYDATTKTLSWPKTTINGEQSISRLFTVQVNEKIPASGQGVSNKTSYDCRIDNTFGNNVSIAIECPIAKVAVEQTVSQLPHTGPRENMIFAATVLAIATFFYARSRQIKKEVRLIRRDFNAGII